MVVLGGEAVSHERGSPVLRSYSGHSPSEVESFSGDMVVEIRSSEKKNAGYQLARAPPHPDLRREDPTKLVDF